MDSKRLRIFISTLAGLSVVLAISHHLQNFWGMELWREALIVLMAVPVLSFLIWLALNQVWHLFTRIEKKRWLLFLFPALLLTVALMWLSYRAPTIWHTLKVIPSAGQSGQAELHEVKYPPGKTVKFSKMDLAKGWVVEGDLVKTTNADAAPLEYSFFSPIGDATSLIFLRSPHSRNVTVVLDGKPMDVTLRDQSVGQMQVTMPTSYKLGIPADIILAIVVICDFLAFFILILLAWLIQEVSQLGDPDKENIKSGKTFLSHKTAIVILVALAIIFHTINFLTAPLVIGPDSPSFMVGATYWMQHHNLDGVPPARGPLTTFLFIPAFLLFGRDPWGVKLVLHLLAVAAVPVMYALGWQLFKRRSLAFCAGLFAVFMPEMYLYSNIVMSDVPNMFFVALACVLTLLALETFSWAAVSAALLSTSAAALLRPENITLPVITAGFLLLKILWERENIRKRLQIFGVAVVIALIPLLAWSAHNQRLHHFFGLSDYAGTIWYDGWVYYGEASGLPITDKNSPAVQKIAEILKSYTKPMYYKDVPTGLDIYPALLDAGYDKNTAMKLLQDAAMDSIRNDPNLTLQLYLFKLKKSFATEHVMTTTFNLPGEKYTSSTDAPDVTAQWALDHFDKERNAFPALIPLQRKIYSGLGTFNQYLYRPLVLFSLCIALLAIYQKDFFKWMPLIVIALTRMIIPVTIGLGSWRYMLSGTLILLTFSLLGVQIARGFVFNIKRP